MIGRLRWSVTMLLVAAMMPAVAWANPNWGASTSGVCVPGQAVSWSVPAEPFFSAVPPDYTSPVADVLMSTSGGSGTINESTNPDGMPFGPGDAIWFTVDLQEEFGAIAQGTMSCSASTPFSAQVAPVPTAPTSFAGSNTLDQADSTLAFDVPSTAAYNATFTVSRGQIAVSSSDLGGSGYTVDSAINRLFGHNRR
jgi:hypothetical protein